MRARILYQALLFLNSTLLYPFAMRSTGSRDLLFFSAVIASLSLTANLAVLLSDSEFRSGLWGLKIGSISLLTWICLRTGIAPPAMALVVAIAAILAAHRDALIGAPSRLSLIMTGGPILATAIWIALAWGKRVPIDNGAILLLLILPYLLMSLASRGRPKGPCPPAIDLERRRAWTLVVSQLLPTASTFIMLTLVSYEPNTIAVANFVLMERAIAIGGSLIYFYARVKGTVRPLTGLTAGVSLLTMVTVSAAAFLDAAGPFIALAYLASGCLLSYGTISLGALHARSILAINSVALVAVAIASSRFFTLQPVDVLAIYICPQLLMMSALVVQAPRRHA